MSIRILFLLFFFGLLQAGRSNVILADFRTSKGDFTMSLDFVNSPLAVANFIQLAGKPDDILETPSGVPVLESAAHYTQSYYRPTVESDVVRPNLRIEWVAPTSVSAGFYAVFNQTAYIGGVRQFAFPEYHADITGEDRIRLQQVSSNPRKYRLTLRYPRPWLDARDQRVKESPMYRVIRVNRVDTGVRFFAGSMTNSSLEHPGYQFQDELIRSFADLSGFVGRPDPYGGPFNSPGVLAMDTLAPNRNGSRFFVTSIPVSDYNGRYTAIGYAVDNAGLNVIRNIAGTTSNSSGTPDQEIIIYDITFRRSGILANAFMEGYQQFFLPENIESLPLSIEQSASGLNLVTALRPQTLNTFYTSPDLRTFTGGFLSGQPPGLTEPGRQFLGTAPRGFYKAFSSKLPSWPSAEVNLENARFFMKPTSGSLDSGSLNLQFNANGTGGTYAIDMIVERTIFNQPSEFIQSSGSGTFTATYDSSEGPYRGILNITSFTGPLNAERFTLHFDSNRLANNPGVTDAQKKTFIRRFDARTTSQTPFLSYNGLFNKLN